MVAALVWVVPKSSSTRHPAGSTVPTPPSTNPWTTASTERTQARVLPPLTAVGDSVLLGAAQELTQRFGVRTVVDAVVSRTFRICADVVDALAASHRLELVLVHCGDNDFIDRADAERIARTVGDGRLVFVLLHVPRAWQSANNQILREVARRHRDTVVDFDAAARAWLPASTYFYADGYHLRPAGRVRYAELIADVLARRASQTTITTATGSSPPSTAP